MVGGGRRFRVRQTLCNSLVTQQFRFAELVAVAVWLLCPNRAARLGGFRPTSPLAPTSSLTLCGQFSTETTPADNEICGTSLVRRGSSVRVRQRASLPEPLILRVALPGVHDDRDQHITERACGARQRALRGRSRRAR